MKYISSAIEIFIYALFAVSDNPLITSIIYLLNKQTIAETLVVRCINLWIFSARVNYCVGAYSHVVLDLNWNKSMFFYFSSNFNAEKFAPTAPPFCVFWEIKPLECRWMHLFTTDSACKEMEYIGSWLLPEYFMYCWTNERTLNNFTFHQICIKITKLISQFVITWNYVFNCSSINNSMEI